jgi:hypothetical protein
MERCGFRCFVTLGISKAAFGGYLSRLATIEGRCLLCWLGAICGLFQLTKGRSYVTVDASKVSPFDDRSPLSLLAA